MSKEKQDFHELVIKTSQRIGKFPSGEPGRQIMVMLNSNQLTQFTSLCSLFRKHKILSEAEAISIASRHFLDSVADE